MLNNTIDSFYDDSYVFDLDKLANGLSVAFALTHYDSNTEMIHEPDYGSVKARLKQWGQDGSTGTTFTDLPTRPCSYEELGLGESTSNSKFYAPH